MKLKSWFFVCRVLFVVVVCVLTLSVPLCNAKAVENTSGTAIASENESTYLQEEFEDTNIKKFLNVYNIGVMVGFGLCSVVYIIGIGAGFFFAILKDIK